MPDVADSAALESMDDEALLRCCVCAGRLQDPALLSCLHSCCKSCAQTLHCHNSSSSDSGRRENAVPSNEVACPSCRTVGTIAVERNALLASRITVWSVLHHAQGCDVCFTRPDQGSEPPDVWCSSSGFVCSNCANEHRMACPGGAEVIHISLDEPQGLDRLMEELSTLCSEHTRSRLKHFCLACEKPKCKDCFVTCLNSQHELEDLGRDQRREPGSAGQLRRHLQRLRKIASSKSSILRQHATLRQELQQAKEEHMDRLRVAKKVIIDAVEAAYKECESSVSAIYDELETSACCLSENAQQLDCAVQQAVNYSSHLLRFDEVALLLDQHSTVLGRLRTLINELKRVREARSASELVIHDITLPTDLVELVKNWFGMPKLATDNVLCTKDDLQLLKECVSLDHRPLKDRTFPVKCLDLAVTDVGNYIVAAGSLGLIEYSQTSDRLTGWSPVDSLSSDDAVAVVDVLSVDVLPDNCVAVGLSAAPFVTVLHRISFSRSAATGWTEKMRFVGLAAPCWHLSVYGTLIAVAEGRWDVGPGRLLPASRVTLLRESCNGTPFLRLQLLYDVFCVAVTQDAVVTASSGLAWVPKTTSSEAVGRYLLEGYTHSGDLMWRRSVREPVWDIVASSAGSILYLILPGTAVVTAVSCRSGGRLKDLSIDDHGDDDSSGRRCSATAAARAFLFRGYELVVLCSDSTTMRTYSSLP